jgi:signal transduction histidine kinase
VRIVEKRKYQRQLRAAEQERALERERARIAQDLHDDLGSSLARISLLSGLALADLQNPRELETHVTKITQSADETVRALEEIVWAVRPGSDTLQSLVEYIAHFANELFEGNRTACRLDLPHDLPAQTLPPDLRHNIFLIVKEALTNVLKHASAREVQVQARATGHTLEILVQDNGRRIDSARPSQENVRHGLENMRRRAEAIGGTLTMQSKLGGGTTVMLTVNFPAWKVPAAAAG